MSRWYLDHFYVLYHIISFRKAHTSVLDYSRKKKKQGTLEYGVEDMERYSKWIFWGLIKRNMEFPGVIKKKP